MGEEQLLTLGETALRLGVLPWCLDRLCTRGAIPFRRAGRMRLVRVADLDAVRTAAEKAGYVRDLAATK
jgi:hypothetical protein